MFKRLQHIAVTLMLTNVKLKYFTKSTYDKGALLMCKYGKANLYNLGVIAKQNVFNVLKFKSAVILYQICIMISFLLF